MKKDADYVFYELTRSICPKCRHVTQASEEVRSQRSGNARQDLICAFRPSERLRVCMVNLIERRPLSEACGAT